MFIGFVLSEGTSPLMAEPEFGPWVLENLQRYLNRDFGDLPAEYVPMSKEALDNGRGFSLGVYTYKEQTIWIGQSLPGEPNPVVFFPSEY